MESDITTKEQEQDLQAKILGNLQQGVADLDVTFGQRFTN